VRTDREPEDEVERYGEDDPDDDDAAKMILFGTHGAFWRHD
jgi:hypothetical protein